MVNNKTGQHQQQAKTVLNIDWVRPELIKLDDPAGKTPFTMETSTVTYGGVTGAAS